MQTDLPGSRQQGVLMLASGGLLMGTIGVFVEEARLGALTLVFFRCLFGMLALAAYCAYKGWLSPRQFTRRTLALSLISGVLMVTQWVAFFDAIHRTSIAVSTVVFHVQPFWVVLMGAALFHERLGADRLGWIGIAFVGLVLASGVLAESHVADHTSYMIGIAESLGGSVLYASVTLIAKSMRNFRPHLFTLMQCVVGTVCLPLVAPFFAPLELAHISGVQWGWLVGMGVLHTGLSYVLIYGALPMLTTPVIAVLLFVYPLTAIAVDALVYGRALSVPQLAGMVLIVVASLGVNLGWRLMPPRLVKARR
ncbi:DMT family transporter [Paraburkholderia unamae]|uniref:Threonine/homoserine efflux transporter RhtA n=1 Tax=Paraburkholderia unamae TaxID=219649 RepID=A0ABX5KPK6_9BURK|nr:DMT family transporter [Paraburkholderia unamae]PVX84187.1 threonine/homoserine efflux transporter RhtA [Paraburkholderia unamae]RAR49486.1 threonine/homoserine efflux transporter RhtA [Paraburkholderia unamae]